MPGSTIVIYVSKGKQPITVTFNANGGTGTMNDQSFTYDIAQNLTANAFEKYGHTFAGWSKTSNGSIILILSFFNVLIFPEKLPTTTASPNLKVPF